MNKQLSLWLLPGLIVAFTLFVVVAVKIGRRRDAQRLKAMAGVASQLNLPYVQWDNSILPQFGGYAFYQNGSLPQATSVMRTNAGDIPMVLFDYQVTIGTDKNRNLVQRSVAAFDLGATPLPGFYIEGGRDSGFTRFMDKVFSPNGIKFDEDPDFERAFNVSGQNTDAVRRVLNAAARKFLLQHPYWMLRSTGRWLLISWLRERPKPEEYAAFIASTTEGMRVLTGAQS